VFYAFHLLTIIYLIIIKDEGIKITSELKHT